MSEGWQHFLPWLFPKLLAGVYCIAFASLLPQVPGLYGSGGILPISAYLVALRETLPGKAYRLFPTLFWLDSSDEVLAGGALLGVFLSLLVMIGVAPVPLLILLWLLYLSYTSVGQEFLGYQWDALLLEAGFMTIFLPLTAWAPPLVVFTYRFFLFRFMFSSGAVKLLSGDSTWRDLTALCHHYQTQPLPTRLAWYVHQLPVKMQKASTAATFFFELAVPFLALAPSPWSLAGFWLLVFFQGVIFATGNYGFFNVLTVVLAVPLLDDRFLGALLPVAPPPAPGPMAAAQSALFALFFLLNLCRLVSLFYRPRFLAKIFALLAPFHISCHYGLFAVMTVHRFEFVVEGSNDRKVWIPYEFRWKPGEPSAPPRQAAPHQPRLDWQMWFAALEPRSLEPWLINLVFRLLEGAPPVLRLFRKNPFPGAPPAYIRLTLYSYRFADRAEKKSQGVWWQRTLVGHFPPLSLESESGEKRGG